MSVVQKLKQSQNTKAARAARTMAALELIGTPTALELRTRIEEKLQEASVMLQKVSAQKGSVKLLAMQSRQADRDLLAVTKGYLSLSRLLAPKLFNQLPTFDEMSTIDADGFVEQMLKVFDRGDERSKQWAADLLGVKTKRLEVVRAWQEAVQSEAKARETKALQAETDQLLKEAEALIIRNAKPGSPAYSVFHRKAAGKPAPEDESDSTNASDKSPTSKSSDLAEPANKNDSPVVKQSTTSTTKTTPPTPKTPSNSSTTPEPRASPPS